jgi:radical SAM family protein
VRILLVSTYELGHQPLHVASPAGALRARGHEVRAVDVSVQPWDRTLVDWADGVAFSVPMHTAMRMALPLAASVRSQRHGLSVCLYGLYAAMGRDLTADLADLVIAGEYEPALLEWAAGTGAPSTQTGCDVLVHIGRSSFTTPARDLLPPLERYARLVLGDDERLTAAVEASHGCSHRCRHCPLPVVYDGRLRVVPEDVVVADVAQLVAMGASHVSFADPDFLNGPRHAIRVAQAVHSCFPELSFDCTTKVEHILAHEELWPALAAMGCLFVVSAFESVDDVTLRILDKGHTAADESAAVSLLRRHGIEIRPSWLPFTPWTRAADLVAMLDFVVAHDLVGNVDAVQYTIRLLLPEGSLLSSLPEVKKRLWRYEGSRLSWVWTSEEAGLDELQEKLAALVETASSRPSASGADGIFTEIQERVYAYARESPSLWRGYEPVRGSASMGPSGPRPRLSEPWFCCSEPTLTQREAVGAGPNRPKVR